MQKNIFIRGAMLALVLLLNFSLIGAIEIPLAQDITAESVIALAVGNGDISLLKDGRYTTRINFANGGKIAITAQTEIAGIYLIWDKAPAELVLTSNNGSKTYGQEGYLHQFIDIENPIDGFTIEFLGNTTLCEIKLLTEGSLPKDIQAWETPLEKVDMLLLPTHADDEHLYFGGIMPFYADAGKQIQVAYMVNHNGEPYRPHELLNGLWTVGMKNYPIIPKFLDMYSDSLDHAKTIYNEEEILEYQVGLIRRFRPDVIIGHDINGEYGHGAHRLNSATLQKAVTEAGDSTLHTEMNMEPWDTAKTYLHLWTENPIILDFDTPLKSFNGKTALDMAKEGFACHISQQEYFRVEAKGPYDCRKFGLYRSTVGMDTGKNDLFENIPVVVPEPIITPEPEPEVVPTPEQAPEPEYASTPPEENPTNSSYIMWFILLVIGVVLLLTILIIKGIATKNTKHY